MHLPRKLVLAGVVLGLIPIGLGIAGLATGYWLSLRSTTPNSDVYQYGLFVCSGRLCANTEKFLMIKGLITAGVAAIAVGVVIVLILDILTKNRWIQLLSQIFLYGGPTLILIGLLFYAKYVFEDTTESATTLSLDYSIILIIVACLVGFLVAIYFAFVTGFDHHHTRVLHKHVHSSTVAIDRSQRF
jgi:hypothetical protein